MLRVPVWALCAFLASFSVLFAQEAKQGRKVALLVGINDYSKAGLGNLKCAERDVTDLREVLVNKLGYDKQDVYLMTEKEAFEAKNKELFPLGENIRHNLKGLVEDLAKEDTVFIAFSGHGVHLKALKEKGLHFCPADTNLEKPETLLSISEIYAQLKNHCKAELKILIMDACRNDPSDGRAASNEKLESVTRPLIPKPEGGIVAFFSCSEGQKAFENEKVGHGFFTDSLLRGLSGEAADKEGEITLALLENYLQKDVPTTVKREKGLTVRQIPERLGELRGRGLLTKLAVPTPKKELSGVEKKEPKPGEEREFELAKGVKMKFCWIPAGEAQLGSPKAEQDYITKTFFEGQRPEFLDTETEAVRGKFKTNGFWLGKYEVTQEQWEALMGSNPSLFKGAKLPVENLGWNDCVQYLNKVSEKLVLPLRYEVSTRTESGRFPFTTVKVKQESRGMRLPHENEWEYACRGGFQNSRVFYWENEAAGTKANYAGSVPFRATMKEDYLRKTAEVGSYETKIRHPWGLCDMHGNVHEWCENLYSEARSERVVRGGSWSSPSYLCRSAFRNGEPPIFGGNPVGLGFRVCLDSD